MAHTDGKISTIASKCKWVIENFCTNTDVGDRFESPIFSALTDSCQNVWKLELYPRGRKQANKDWLSIFLNNLSNQVVVASAKIELLNNKNDVVKTGYIDNKKYGVHDNWGISKFVEGEFVTDESNAVLNNGKLTIVCKIIVTANAPRAKKPRLMSQAERDEHEESELRLRHLNKYERLIEDKAFSDVSLIVEGKQLQAHKCILANGSPVFAAMFQTEMKEKLENKVEITDIRHHVFVEVLRFVYTGKVNGIKSIVGELVAAADKYSLDGLKIMCEKTMRENLSIDTAVESLKLADRHRLGDLKAKVIKFIVSRSDDIVSKPEFDRLSELHSALVCEVLRAVMQKKK